MARCRRRLSTPARCWNRRPLYILAGLLVLGFICNLLVRPVADKYFMTDAELAAEPARMYKVMS